MDKIDLLIIVSMYVGYLVFSLFDELIDRFIRKVKSVKIQIPSEDFKRLKKYLKAGNVQMSADKYLQFHVREDVKDLLGDI